MGHEQGSKQARQRRRCLQKAGRHGPEGRALRELAIQREGERAVGTTHVWARGYDGAGDAGRGCRELCWVNCGVAGPAIAGRCAAACYPGHWREVGSSPAPGLTVIRTTGTGRVGSAEMAALAALPWVPSVAERQRALPACRRFSGTCCQTAAGRQLNRGP